jgi:hypothetical protein
MNKTLLTIDYKFLTLIAVSQRGCVLVEDYKNGNQRYWVTRRVFNRLITLQSLDGVIVSTPNMQKMDNSMSNVLMVLSPF